MSQDNSLAIQLYHNLLIRLSLRAENGEVLTEEEALLYAESCRYLTATAKAIRMLQEDYNKLHEKNQEKEEKENDDEDGRPAKL